MKAELTLEYLHSIELEPLPRFVQMSEDGWVDTWKKQAAEAADYDSFPSSWSIPQSVWDAKLKAAWARLAEYDRLTAARRPKETQP